VTDKQQDRTQRSDDLRAGRAAGYCWVRNPHQRGRCTWEPGHSGDHKDRYAHTEWKQTPPQTAQAPATGSRRHR
jgi:hypothetical protein